MTRLARTALELMEAAESAAHAGGSVSDMTILISREGAIRMVAGSDWHPEALRAQHGAQSVYTVTNTAKAVRVEGRELGGSCVFESVKPHVAARLLLGGGYSAGFSSLIRH